MSYAIRLDDDAEITESTDFGVVDGWWVDDNVITIVRRAGAIKSRYKLPRGKPRVTVHRLGGGQAQLALGGYVATTVTVVGPTEVIDKLREAVL